MELKWYSSRGHFWKDLIAELNLELAVNVERSQRNVCGSRTFPRFLQTSNPFQADIAFILMYICSICSIFAVILTEYRKRLNNGEHKYLLEMGGRCKSLDIALENHLNWHETKLSSCKDKIEFFWRFWFEIRN